MAFAVRMMRQAISPRLAMRMVRRSRIEALGAVRPHGVVGKPCQAGAFAGGNEDRVRPERTQRCDAAGDLSGRAHSVLTFIIHAGLRFSRKARMPSRPSPA